jgi:predicted membrane protein
VEIKMETQQFERTQRFATAEDWFDEDEFEELSEPFVTDEECFEQGAAFDGFRIEVRSRRFRSGRVTAVLSGVTVDLREAIPSPEGATLDVQSALSGITILVPKDWEVFCDVEAVCGGISEDRFSAAAATARPRLRVTGTVVAGGLSVR